MAIKDWTEVIHEDFPHPEKITRTMIEAAVLQGKGYSGCVRFATGRISTTEELEERREYCERKWRNCDSEERSIHSPEPKPSLLGYLRKALFG